MTVATKAERVRSVLDTIGGTRLLAASSHGPRRERQDPSQAGVREPDGEHEGPHGALAMVEAAEKDLTVVTVAADSGMKYLSTALYAGGR